MRTPAKFTIEELKEWGVSTEQADGRWVPCRPMGLCGIQILHRIRLSWMVFTGRADVVTWKEEL